MSSDNNRYENYIAKWKAERKAKKLRRVEDLSLAECNAIFARISELVGVPNVQNADILPELTSTEHAVMLTQVLAQTEDLLHG